MRIGINIQLIALFINVWKDEVSRHLNLLRRSRCGDVWPTTYRFAPQGDVMDELTATIDKLLDSPHYGEHLTPRLWLECGAVCGHGQCGCPRRSAQSTHLLSICLHVSRLCDRVVQRRQAL